MPRSQSETTLIGHVLSPVDFSKRCAATAPYAISLADRFKARLTFTHVIPGLPYQGTEKEAFYGPRGEIVSGRELDRYYRTRLDDFVQEATGNADVGRILLKGDISQRIEEYARNNAVDLVVIPTHGYGPFRHLLLGSVASRILHDLTCAIFSGAHTAEPPEIPPRFKRVACALDLGPHSEKVLHWACEFARVWEASLALIHVTPRLEFEVYQPHFVKDDWRDKMAGAGREAVERLMERVGCEAHVHVEAGHPVHSVVSRAADERADLLIIGRGRASEISSRLTTHAYGIIREARCPVISI